MSPRVRSGAIILCGGKSTRMGRDKATLAIGAHETMLERVVRLVSEAIPADHIVCVAAPSQSLPPLPDAVQVVRDPTPYQGPLAGLATGLASLGGRADAVFVTGCDALLLVPAAILRMFELLGNHEIAAAHDQMRWHPLMAVYRTHLLPRVESLLAAGERSLSALVEGCDSRRVSAEELREVDPELESLQQCNSPEEYERAMERVKFGV